MGSNDDVNPLAGVIAMITTALIPTGSIIF